LPQALIRQRREVQAATRRDAAQAEAAAAAAAEAERLQQARY